MTGTPEEFFPLICVQGSTIFATIFVLSKVPTWNVGENGIEMEVTNMLWAYAKLRAGGEFGLFVTGVHDGFLCKACKMY